MIALQYVLIQSSFCVARGRVSGQLSAPPLSIRRTTWRQITEREISRGRAVNKLIRPMTKRIKKGLVIRDGLMLPTVKKSDPEKGKKHFSMNSFIGSKLLICISDEFVSNIVQKMRSAEFRLIPTKKDYFFNNGIFSCALYLH